MLPINKKRILKMPKQLSALPSGTEIRIALKANTAHETRSHRQIGFSNLPNEGDAVLPSVVGAATKKNSEGYYHLHKDRPKVLRSFEVASRRSQFRGRYDREIVEEYHSYSKLCWQRTFIEPSNIELTYQKGADEDFYYASPVFRIGEDDDLIICAINVFLDLFHLCYVCDNKTKGLPSVTIRRVNWELLRPGTADSTKVLNQLVKSIPKAPQRTLAKRQFSRLHQFVPSELAVGKGGFKGYVAFRFDSIGLTVLESIEPNNATYVFGDDWESLSQMTKHEILFGNLHIDRIIHTKDWLHKIKYLLRMQKSA